MVGVVLLRLSSPCLSLPSYTRLFSVSARSSVCTTARTHFKKSIYLMAANGINGHVTGVRQKHDFSGFKVNQDRLMKNIHEGCEYGAAWRYGEFVVAYKRCKTCALTKS